MAGRALGHVSLEGERLIVNEPAGWPGQDGVIGPRALPASYVVYTTGNGYFADDMTGSSKDFFNASDAAPVVQGAINSLTGGTIFIKTGIYPLNTGLTGKNEVILQGTTISDSSLGTTLKANASMSKMLDLTGKSHFGIYNVNFDGNSLATNGIDASDPSVTRNLARLDKVTVQNCLGIGIDMSRMEDSNIFDCLLLRNDTNLKWSQAGSAGHVVRTTFGRATTSSAVIGGTQHTFDDCVFTQYTPTAAAASNAIISVAAFVSVLNLKNCWIETPSGILVKVESGQTLQQLNLNGCYFIEGVSSTAISGGTIQVANVQNVKLETNDGTQLNLLTITGGGNKQVKIDGFTTAGSPTPNLFGTLNTPFKLFVVNNQAGNTVQPNMIQSHVKAGAPVDGDFPVAEDGLIVTDTTNNKIWTRIGGTWKGVAVA